MIDIEVKIHRIEAMIDEMKATVTEKSPTHKYIEYFAAIKATVLEIRNENMKLWKENKDLGRSLVKINKD